jgi:hypothetical protein
MLTAREQDVQTFFLFTARRVLLLAPLVLGGGAFAQTADPLPSWNDRPAKGWTVVSMKTDWKKIFPFE